MNRRFPSWTLLLSLVGACEAAHAPADVGDAAEARHEDADSGKADTRAPVDRDAPDSAGLDRAPDTADAAPASDAAFDAGADAARASDAAIDAGADAAPDAQAPETPTTCIVSDSAMRMSMFKTWKETWDPAQRVKLRYESDAADSRVLLGSRYREDGRMVAHAGLYAGGEFQHDLAYDEHGNHKDFKLSYPDPPNLSVPSPAPVWIGTSYAHVYAADGKLLSSTATSYGPGFQSSPAPATRTTYTHDAEGRCQRIESTRDSGSVELYTYDAAGRVATVQTDRNTVSPHSRWCASVLATNEYDAAGRLRQSIIKATPNHGCDERLPYWTQNYTYAADGSVTIESISYDTDVTNDTVVIDGKATPVSRSVQTRSAGCAAIDALTTPDVGNACSAR
jgi:hypothetical protein